ncbi:hypothetical protein HanIR_Chr04g0188931 [Helianthus annuus]|nr:hypothetical protein HanIR_Chr04g0188931 [Helianthus annuus]
MMKSNALVFNDVYGFPQVKILPRRCWKWRWNETCGKHDPGKDMRLVLGLAKFFSQPTPIVAAVNGLYKVAKSHCLSHLSLKMSSS